MLPIILLVMFPIVTLQAKFPSPKGMICNVEMFQTASERVVSRYFCVEAEKCGSGHHRFPVLPYDGCSAYFYATGGSALTCCHQADLLNGTAGTWAPSNRYLPGLRSYLMCKNHSHTLCGSDDKNYCYKDNDESRTSLGIPTAIDKYPHTALIGYLNENYKWHWFCMGSIINTRFILTSVFCLGNGTKPSTHVKVGESRVCQECPDRLEEQVLEILHRKTAKGGGLQDVALLELQEDILYNKNVRPACLAARQPTRQSQGLFARYGKPDRLIKTDESARPVMFYPQNTTLFTFKVKTSGEAVVYLGETGEPYARTKYIQVFLGQEKSGVQRGNDLKISVVTGDILRSNFQGFWILNEKGHIQVGKEDETSKLFEWTDPDPFDVSVAGVSTPDSSGEWIFADHETLSSLHDIELEVLYGEDCGEYYPNITTTEYYERFTGDPYYVDEIVFCAGNFMTGKGPCDNDWGGAVQVMSEELYCMWQIFGVYGVHAKNYPRACSAVNRPAIFTNMANLLVWAEHHAFRDFSFNEINVQQPECTISRDRRGQKGRC